MEVERRNLRLYNYSDSDTSDSVDTDGGGCSTDDEDNEETFNALDSDKQNILLKLYNREVRSRFIILFLVLVFFFNTYFYYVCFESKSLIDLWSLITICCCCHNKMGKI